MTGEAGTPVLLVLVVLSAGVAVLAVPVSVFAAGPAPAALLSTVRVSELALAPTAALLAPRGIRLVARRAVLPVSSGAAVPLLLRRPPVLATAAALPLVAARTLLAVLTFLGPRAIRSLWVVVCTAPGAALVPASLEVSLFPALGPPGCGASLATPSS